MEARDRPDYVVLLKSVSAVRFPVGGSLVVRGLDTAIGSAILTFRTRHADEGFEVPVPRELLVDVRGASPSLNEAIYHYWNAANSLVPVLALGANAMVEDLDIELAFDSTVGSDEHEFFQKITPESDGLMFDGREVDIEATLALMLALARHSETSRLQRAATHYRLALGHWRFGRDLLALAHLFIAAETLTQVALRDCLRRKSLTEPQLAASWDIDPTKPGYVRQLQAEVRRRLVFQCNSECYKLAKDASDGMEHGYGEFDVLIKGASRARERTASYVRESIIRLANVDPKTYDSLMSEQFMQPMGLARHDWYLRGNFIGQASGLSAYGYDYPFVLWERRIIRMWRDEEGLYKVQADQKITPIMGPEAKFQLTSASVWADPYQPQRKGPPSAPVQIEPQIVSARPTSTGLLGRLFQRMCRMCSGLWRQGP